MGMPTLGLQEDTLQTIFIHWHGPFLMEEIKCGSCSSGEFAKKLLGNGLYAVTGKLKGQHNARLQYIGITEKGYTTRWDAKHIVHDVTREQKLWLGNVAYRKSTREILELAETMLVFFNDEVDLLNQKKRVNPPDEDCTLISMFFKKTTDEMYLKLPSIVRMLPEVLIWHEDTKVLRHKGRLDYFDIS